MVEAITEQLTWRQQAHVGWSAELCQKASTDVITIQIQQGVVHGSEGAGESCHLAGCPSAGATLTGAACVAWPTDTCYC